MAEHRCHEAPKPCHEEKKSLWLSPFLLISIGTLVLLGLSYGIPAMAGFHEIFIHYGKTIWWAILLGFFLGGIIDHFVPSTYVSHYLAISKKSSVFYAVGLGFLMSACSHGILAIAMALHKKGASGPAIVSFLLASPWANLPITVLLFGFFGMKAILILMAAIVIALITGLIFMRLQALSLIEANPHGVETDEEFSIYEDIKKRWNTRVWSRQTFINDVKGIAIGSWSLTQMVLWWVLIGMVLASLAGTFVPEHFFHHYMGPGLIGLLITLGAATVIEVCSEGSAPIAFEIYRQSHTLGNSFVFLMAGVITDYTEIGLIWKNVGHRTAVWMVIITVPQALAIGWVFNRLF